MNTTNEARAAYHLNRRRAVRAPRAEEQSGEGLFLELQPQPRRLVEPDVDGLFTQPPQQRRGLVAVDGWPDYRAGVA
jgi:hypothetical protein